MPNRIVRLLPECHADTALIRFLFPDPILSIHCEGCTEVANTMLSSGRHLYRFIGIVDNDNDLNKRNKGFFSRFEPVLEQHRVFVRHHPTDEQVVLILDKAIETFLLWNSKQVDIDVEQYGLSPSLKRLKDQFKTPTIETDPNYIRLLTDLANRQAPGIVTLKNILNEFIFDK